MMPNQQNTVSPKPNGYPAQAVTCTTCGGVNPAHLAACLNCAEPLANPCPICGHTVPGVGKFCSQCGAKLAETAANDGVNQLRRRQQALLPANLLNKLSAAGNSDQLFGEKREVTLLVASLLYTHPAPAESDDEEIYFVHDELMQRLGNIVKKYEGTLVKFTAHGMMAVFGAPEAHENDPERAARAALEMQATLEDWQRQPENGLGLSAQIALHTGLVVAGTVGHSKIHLDYTVAGGAVQVAQLLELNAKPGEILLSSDTHRRVRPVCVCEPLPPLVRTDPPQTIGRFRLTGLAASPEPKADLLSRPTAMIGRARELAQLQAALAAVVAQGRSRVALLTGQASLAKSQFLANVSHELRTPLNGILGYAQILKNDRSLRTDHHKAIETIFRSGEHLLLLINDILDLSKIEARHLTVRLDDFLLDNFIQTLLDIINVRVRHKALSLTYLPAENLPEIIHSDEKRLRQILLNLLSNAVKFTDRGGLTFRLEARPPATPHPDPREITLWFEISDTGIGIAPEDHDLIFDFFTQVGHADGTGLGLAITKRLVDLLGGTIALSSQPGQGSTFTVTIPVRASMAAVQRPMPDPAGKVTGYRHSGQPCKILAVDDHSDNRLILRMILEPLGFDFYEASNGQDALEIVANLQPDLVLLDLLMPGIDGFETARQMRRLPGFGQQPIIAVSASVVPETIEKSQAAGCDDFLKKPISSDELLQKMAAHLSLQWTYLEPAISPPVGFQPDDLAGIPLPPRPDLLRLHYAAKTGDIGAIQSGLARLQPNYPDFASPLLEIAERFRVDLLEESLTALINRLPR